jgi:hypothetical protein
MSKAMHFPFKQKEVVSHQWQQHFLQSLICVSICQRIPIKCFATHVGVLQPRI